MIETNLSFCENDLKETYFAVCGGSDIPVKHTFTESGDKVINTVVAGGKAYAYGNYIGGGAKTAAERKKLVKRYAKLSVYKALAALTGNNLPWGALTGVRPTKLAYDEIERTGDFTELFTDVMKVSPEKTELIKDVVENQKGIYRKDAGDDFFVFIPFCPSRCNYCSFITFDLKYSEKYVSEYLNALYREIESAKKLVKNLRSVYVGGGTPVSLEDSALDELLSLLEDFVGVEFTVEAGRPDRITESNLEILKRRGVNRICVNPQTFNDETLKRIGRNHTAQDIIDKYLLAKNDFSVNMDLIAGLDGETFDDFKYSLDKTVELSPDGITVHTLSVKAGAAISGGGKFKAAGDIEKMIDYAHKTLKSSGYKPYYLYRQKYMTGGLENTGYARGGKFSVYNIDTMEEIAKNIACGAGAVSKFVSNADNKIIRYGNPKDVKTYVQKIDNIMREKAEIFR